ncbi:MAG: LacI family DNA-binding transcriptional regulator [Akkermansiaceae bacterium]|nr:LacI family DNA-binding transcriptional regulator [Armatimonadota bacterium]
MRKAPTLKDVASLAGVSPYTVSAVINGARSNTQVSEATRLRIFASAEKVNYHPNAVARSLASRRTYCLGVQFGILEPTEAIGNAYATALLQGIMGAAAIHRYNVLLFTETWVNARQSAPAFRDRRTDGVILVAPLTDTDMLPALSALPLPLVAVSPNPSQCPAHTPSVDVDNSQGIMLAVRHLAGLGHTRIAHVTGNANVASVIERRQAFLETVRKCDLPATPDEYLVTATYDAATIPEILPALMALPVPPTAIVAGNDNIAFAIIAACRALNVRVPEELSVVGFDDTPSAREITPALTTIRQPLQEIGAEAVRLLLGEINSNLGTGTDEERMHLPTRLRPQLILRESTATYRV